MVTIAEGVDYWEGLRQIPIRVLENLVAPIDSVLINALVGAAALVVAVYIPLAILLMDKSSNAWSWDRLVLVNKVLDLPRLFSSTFVGDPHDLMGHGYTLAHNSPCRFTFGV